MKATQHERRSDVEKQKPIPIPLRQRWHVFRVSFLPVLVFAGLVITIGWTWTRYVAPATVVGQVEIVRSNIVSVADTVREINVQRDEAVSNGQVLAVMTAIEPDQLQGELAAAEANLRLMKARTDWDRTRNPSNYSRLRAD
jgi:multidrug resistance efflux pump